VQKAEAAHELALKTGDEDKIEKTSADVAKAESARADFAGQCVKCIQTKVNRRKLIVERGIVDQDRPLAPRLASTLEMHELSQLVAAQQWRQKPPSPPFPPMPSLSCLADAGT